MRKTFPGTSKVLFVSFVRLVANIDELVDEYCEMKLVATILTVPLVGALAPDSGQHGRRAVAAAGHTVLVGPSGSCSAVPTVIFELQPIFYSEFIPYFTTIDPFRDGARLTVSAAPTTIITCGTLTRTATVLAATSPPISSAWQPSSVAGSESDFSDLDHDRRSAHAWRPTAAVPSGLDTTATAAAAGPSRSMGMSDTPQPLAGFVLQLTIRNPRLAKRQSGQAFVGFRDNTAVAVLVDDAARLIDNVDRAIVDTLDGGFIGGNIRNSTSPLSKARFRSDLDLSSFDTIDGIILLPGYTFCLDSQGTIVVFPVGSVCAAPISLLKVLGTL
jgi:hypothetical protein